jgi:fructosamine-3-kinase
MPTGSGSAPTTGDVASLPREAIALYAAERFGHFTKLDIGSARPLEGGFGSRAIFLFDVALTLASGEVTTFTILQKHTWANEVLGLRALHAVPDAACLPELIAHGGDEEGEWVLLPKYEGHTPSGRLDAHPQIFDTLAHVHAYYMDRIGELEGITVIDTGWWKEMCLEVTLPVVEQQLQRHEDADLAVARTTLIESAEDPRIPDALEILPATLLHGDMHHGNVIVGRQGVKIVDWGNARIGPSMFDIANIAEHNSLGYRRYCDTWRDITDGALDPWLAEVGYQWGTVLVNTQYLGFAVTNLPEHVGRMVQSRQRGLESLGLLLARGEGHGR